MEDSIGTVEAPMDDSIGTVEAPMEDSIEAVEAPMEDSISDFPGCLDSAQHNPTAASEDFL